MPTTKARINISVPEDMKEMLFKLARRERIPAATKAARLLEAALEMEEDQIWETIAQKRDTKRARYISHRKAWK